MILLTGSTELLRARLSAAAATTNPTFVFGYGDDGAATSLGSNAGSLSGTTNVTLVASPAASAYRVVRSGYIYNADTAAVTVIVEHYNGTTARQICSVNLGVGYTLQFTDRGISVTDANGNTSTGYNAPSQDLISGLKMVWNSATSISVTTGEAYIPALGQTLYVNSTLTLSALALTASTFYHVYLYSNAGNPAIECVTTSPASPYYGTARTKTGDTSRRYVGSVKTDSSGNIYNFYHNLCNGKIDYLSHSNVAPFNVLNGGAASVTTSVDCSGIVPVSSRSAIVFADNADTTTRVGIGTSDIGTLSGSNFLYFLYANAMIASPFALDATQKFTYLYFATPSTGNFYARVTGYFFER